MYLVCMNCTTSSSLSITRRVGGFRLDSSTRRCGTWPVLASACSTFQYTDRGLTQEQCRHLFYMSTGLHNVDALLADSRRTVAARCVCMMMAKQ